MYHCPVCGSKEIRLIEKDKKTYRCLRCDEIFSEERNKFVPAETVPNKKIKSPAEVYRENIDAIFRIEYNDEAPHAGTGFYISEDGYALTNAHVVSKNRVICEGGIASENNSSEKKEFKVERIDYENDLALIKVDVRHKVKCVRFSPEKPNIGEDVYAIGNSKGLGLAIVNGIVGDTNRVVAGINVFLFNALVTNGCSGGPVFNSGGMLCGVVFGGVPEAAGMNFAITLTTIKKFLGRN